MAASHPAAVPPGSVTAVITTTAIPTMIGTPVNDGLASRVDSRLLGLEPRRSAACMTSGAQPWNKLDFRSPAAKAKPRLFGGDDVDPALTRPLLLVLNGGSNTDPNAMASRLAHTLDEQNNVGKWPVAPCAGDNYDPVNGEQFDLVDDHVMDELRRDVAAGVYAAAYACQKQSTFVPQKRAMGPHPYRSAEGSGRYKMKGQPPNVAETVRQQTLRAVRTAELIDLFWTNNRPFLVEMPAIRSSHVSVGHLDEYRKLLSLEGVAHHTESDTSWFQHRIDITDLRMDACSPEQQNRYLIAKLKLAMDTPKALRPAAPLTTTAAEAASFGFKEEISWKNQLCGFVPPTEKEQADKMAIGGLRDAATSVGKLSAVATFGRRMYAAIRETLVADHKTNEDQGTPEQSWVSVTCKAIGSKEERVPPEAAIEAVRAIMVRYTAAVPAGSSFVHLTEVDAHLLEAWRKAAGDPDDQVFQWLTQGAPAGVLDAIKDPGIFPDTSGPSAMDPDDLDCDEATFRNYAGVEDNVETEAELRSHISNKHIVSFGTYNELTEYVGGGKVILNKIGLIEKIRNGKKKVRMILDTKASDVKRITGKAQRVMLPRLYDAILHLLYLMALLAGDVGGVRSRL